MTTRYTDEVLESMRRIGDPVPDSIIAALSQDDQLPEVNAILQQLMKNHHPIPEELPDNIEFWLRDTAQLPPTVDRQRLQNAADFFVEHGLAISLILSTSSLVECFAARKGVKALTCTYRLEHSTYHRIAETSQFMLLIMAPGGLFEGGSGIPAIQKVRLMHSAIRYLIKARGDWDMAELGEPINQEDMLGTLLTFTHIVIRDLRRLGKEISEQEAEDYLYLWQVVGKMMGIFPKILPRNITEAAEAAAAIRRRHWGPSPEGIELTKALLEMQADLIPGTAFDGIIPALIRRLVGDDVADWLDVPHSRWDVVVRHKRKLGRFLDILDRRFGGLADIVDQMAVNLMTRQSIRLNGYERAAFEIPAQLECAWAKEDRLSNL